MRTNKPPTGTPVDTVGVGAIAIANRLLHAMPDAATIVMTQPARARVYQRRAGRIAIGGHTHGRLPTHEVINPLAARGAFTAGLLLAHTSHRDLAHGVHLGMCLARHAQQHPNLRGHAGFPAIIAAALAPPSARSLPGAAP